MLICPKTYIYREIVEREPIISCKKVWNHTFHDKLNDSTHQYDSFNYRLHNQEWSSCDIQYSWITRWIFYDSSRDYSFETFRYIICNNMTSTNHYHIYEIVTLYFIYIASSPSFLSLFDKHALFSRVIAYLSRRFPKKLIKFLDQYQIKNVSECLRTKAQ